MTYRVGIGKADITGPCVEVGFFGMSNIGQQGEGLHTRLFARAFLLADESDSRLAIVVVDLGACSQAVKLEVVRRLAGEGEFRVGGRPLYTDENVMITATHTHSGPGGYSSYFAYNASIPGFNRRNFECIVSGIVESIRRAHSGMEPTRVYAARGRLPDCGGNRSEKAYLNNPPEELARYGENVDRDMDLLKFVAVSGRPLGAVNWCAVHPTSMGEKNRLISGDNKGIAAMFFEREHAGLVGAFANSCCGDQSPNMKFGERPDGVHDVERALEIGSLQYREAARLFQDAAREIQGPISCRLDYVDMSGYPDSASRMTWPAAMGYGMLNGSREDSEGMKVRKWGEGTTKSNFREDFDLTLEIVKGFLAPLIGIHWPHPSDIPAGYEAGHAEKPIVFHLGLAKFRGVPLAPSVLPVQMFKIGPLVIAGHPGELTTMAGRRLRETVRLAFGPQAPDPIILAAYANAYSSYTTTREEYAMQHYEGASTLFGPRTLEAYQREHGKLARAIRDDVPVACATSPPEIAEGRLLRGPERGIPDGLVPGLSLGFGSVESDIRRSYRRGESASATLLGGYPNNDLRTGSSYLAVERKDGAVWKAVFDDHDISTYFRWHPRGLASMITIDWLIPLNQPPGTYRIRYNGSYWIGYPREMRPIESVSGEFRVVD